MNEFVFLFRGGAMYDSKGAKTHSPEQMQQLMQKWTAWMKDLGEKGHVSNSGNPLEYPGRVVRGSEKAVTDGPYAEKDIVSGFVSVLAKDLAHAAELAGGCPIFSVGGLVEVRPVMKMHM